MQTQSTNTAATQRTPGPWHIEGKWHEDELRLRGPDEEVIAVINRKASDWLANDCNASFLLTACNAHDELVAALRKCEAGLAHNVEKMRISNFGDDKLLTELRSALAKVTP